MFYLDFFLKYKCHSMNTKNIFEKKRKIIFFHKCKLHIVWNWFIVRIILILQKYLFWDKQCSSLEQRSDIKLWWMRSTNYLKFTEECMMLFKEGLLIFIYRDSRIWNFCLLGGICLFFLCVCVCNMGVFSVRVFLYLEVGANVF